ncbi:MAG: hypothetical protein O2894_13705, partial [Planctomycetota bacterium]|nr:hypothetical protein [Planctomycetota bacterium]
MSSRMRSLTRTNLVLGGCALLLALILVVRPDTVASVDRDDLPLVFSGLPRDQIRRIEITQPGSPAIVLQLGGSDGTWLLESHGKYPTQAGAARLLDAIGAARNRGDVTTRKDTFAKYAGDTGWTEVRLTDVQGNDVVQFGVGRYAYPEVFLRVGRGESERVVRALNITPGVARTEVRSWIETRIWPELSATDAVRIDVEQRKDGRTITLAKRGVPEAQTGLAVP